MDIQAVGMSTSYLTHMTSSSLSEEEKSSLQEILSKYDPDNMSQEDRESLKAELEEEGLWGNVNTFRALDDAGFAPPPPPQGGMPGMSDDDEDEETSNSAQLMLDLLNQLESGELTQDDFTAQLESLIEDSGTTTGNIVDQYR